MTPTRWGALAFLSLAVAMALPPLVWLAGDLRTALGVVAYDLADLLAGPVWAASAVAAVLTLRREAGKHPPMTMNLALLAVALAAGAMVAAACMRSANRHYHLLHPELHLEDSVSILVVWTTLLNGLRATGMHFLGWTLVLMAASGLATGRLPSMLRGLYVVAGVLSVAAYAVPSLEEGAVALAFAASIWQGVLLWRPGEGEAGHVARN
jgi:hypothetical protein